MLQLGRTGSLKTEAETCGGWDCCRFAAAAADVAASTGKLEELRCWVLGTWDQAEQAAASVITAGGCRWSEP